VYRGEEKGLILTRHVLWQAARTPRYYGLRCDIVLGFCWGQGRIDKKKWNGATVVWVTESRNQGSTVCGFMFGGGNCGFSFF
jgi:hypothetical protein